MEDKYKYVTRSSYRLKVVKSINTDVKMPRDISIECGILPNHISNVLKQLRDNDIAECVNPEARKGRLYRLSEDGLEILKKLD